MQSSKNNTIAVAASILIRRDIHSVFNYISDLRMDKNWRKEINNTVLLASSPGLNCVAVESSFLSKRLSDNKLNLKCIQYQHNEVVVHQTLPGAPFSQLNSRRVDEVSAGVVRLTYSIDFDAAIVKHAIGFKLPLFLVKYYTAKTMNSYLDKLKHILENPQLSS